MYTLEAGPETFPFFLLDEVRIKFLLDGDDPVESRYVRNGFRRFPIAAEFFCLRLSQCALRYGLLKPMYVKIRWGVDPEKFDRALS